MADMVQIKNSNLDGGNWVKMQGVIFNPGYSKRTSSPPLDGQFSGTSYLIGKGDNVGIEPPSFTITGIISTADFTTSNQFWSVTPSTLTHKSEDGISMAGYITLGYLLSLWRDMSGTTYLKISFGSPDNQFTWKRYDLGSDEIPVVIKAITPTPRQDSEGGHFIDYNIEFTEVTL